VFPVRFELGFYITEHEILHNHCCENLESCISFHNQIKYSLLKINDIMGWIGEKRNRSLILVLSLAILWKAKEKPC
jgi:hypothetical protein